MDQSILLIIIGASSLAGGLLVGKLVFARNTKKQVEDAEAQAAGIDPAAWQEGRKVLVLSERTDHVTAIVAALEPDVPELFVLHGRLGQRQRSSRYLTVC